MAEMVIRIGEKYRPPITAALFEVRRLSWQHVSRSTCHIAILCDGEMSALFRKSSFLALGVSLLPVIAREFQSRPVESVS